MMELLPSIERSKEKTMNTIAKIGVNLEKTVYHVMCFDVLGWFDGYPNFE